MIDERYSKKPRKDKDEAIRELDKQLQAMENKVQAMRRQLVSEPCLCTIAETGHEVMLSTREFVKSTCMLGFQEERPQPRLWTLFAHSYKDLLDKEFVRAVLESETTPQDGSAIVKIVPRVIFEGNYEFWMKAVLDCPILLKYLPTDGRYEDFDDELAWRYPKIRKAGC